MMQGMTDVGEKKGARFSPSTYDWKSAKPNAGIYVGLSYKSIVGVRLEMTKGSIAGNDNNSNSAWVRSRNLNFKSHIIEASLIGTFHPFMLKTYDVLPRISPYIAVGVAYFSYYPKTFYNGAWVNLPPLRTEGQGFSEYPARQRYSLTQIAIPVGCGIKYELSPLYNMRVELLYRNTSADYLDDVSATYVDPSLFSKHLKPAEAALATALSNRQLNSNHGSSVGSIRGNADTKDGYLTVNIKFGLVIGRKRIR